MCETFDQHCIAEQGDNALGTVLLYVHLSSPLMAEPLDLRPWSWYVGRPWPWLGLDCRWRSLVTSRLNSKNQVLTSLLPCFKVWVKVGVKVTDQGQISGVQRSILGARLCRVQQRAKKSHYQSKVFVCRVYVIDRLLILSHFWSF